MIFFINHNHKSFSILLYYFFRQLKNLLAPASIYLDHFDLFHKLNTKINLQYFESNCCLLVSIKMLLPLFTFRAFVIIADKIARKGNLQRYLLKVAKTCIAIMNTSLYNKENHNENASKALFVKIFLESYRSSYL